MVVMATNITPITWNSLRNTWNVQVSSHYPIKWYESNSKCILPATSISLGMIVKSLGVNKRVLILIKYSVLGNKFYSEVVHKSLSNIFSCTHWNRPFSAKIWYRNGQKGVTRLEWTPLKTTTYRGPIKLYNGCQCNQFHPQVHINHWKKYVNCTENISLSNKI